MSRRTVRAGVRAWLSSSVAGINTVYRAAPRFIPAQDFTAGKVGASDGCVAWVHIAGDNERRIATGKKQVDYEVEITLVYRHTSPASTGGDAGLDAADAFDDIVENLKARIRADFTAGGTVWQMGESSISNNEPNIAGTYGELIERGDALELNAWITVSVTDQITA